jgi:hypothetical protein
VFSTNKISKFILLVKKRVSLGIISETGLKKEAFPNP